MSELPSDYRNDTDFNAMQYRDDEIDLRELFGAIWLGRWLIITITSVGAVIAVVLALTLPNIYNSEAILAPTSVDQASGLSGLSSQFGGLASLAGINLGGGGIDKTTLAIEVMKSRDFIGKFITQHDLLVPLMASKKWNSVENQLILDDEVYDKANNRWIREPKSLRGAEPSQQEAYKVFLENFNVSQDKTTSLVTVSIEHYSPYIAKQWVEWLVQAINGEMKERDLTEAHHSIAYLETQLAQTHVFEMQSILYQLIEEQTKTVMLAEVRDEYVFKTVDPAIVPELKAKPKRALICVLGTMLAGMLSIFLVLIRHFLRKK